jgi:hypothetical protein
VTGFTGQVPPALKAVQAQLTQRSREAASHSALAPADEGVGESGSARE